MNQRDQYQGSGRRAGRQQQDQQGGRYGARPMSQRSSAYQDEQDWQQRQGGPRSSMGQRLSETYNPEPQWLHEQSQYESPYQQQRGMRASEYRGGYERDEEFGSRGYGGYSGESYGYGEQGGGFRGEMGRPAGAYGQSGRGFGREDYDTRSSYDQQGFGQQRFGPQQTGYGSQSRYGLQGYASEFGARGYEESADYGGYRGRGGLGLQTGGYPSGMEGQRSYRGLGPQNYKRSDDRIRDDVCERLTDSDRIDATRIIIDVNQGTVTLTGTVPQRYMRYAAEDIVDDSLGVVSINNQLKVEETAESPSTAASLGRATEGKKH